MLLGAALWSGGCTKGYDPEPPAVPGLPSPTLTLEALNGLCQDEAVLVREPLVITGLVTSSDEAGNFYRSFTVEEQGAAIEIMAGMEGLHNRYPVGCRVYLSLEGLCMERSRGILQVGPPAAGHDFTAVDYFYAQALLDRYLVRGERETLFVRPTLWLIPELDRALCGTLVLIPHLHSEPLETEGGEGEEGGKGREEGGGKEEEAPGVWSGYRRFADRDGNALYTYTSPYARFADRPLPKGETALCGILQYEERGDYKGFIIKLRDENDNLED